MIVELVTALDASRRTELSLVAEAGGVVVGHVQLSRSWLDAREALVDVLVLSPLSVEPGHQRQGIGTLLVRAAVDAATEVGSPAVFLEGSPDYYGTRGFERASARGFTRPSARIPDPAFQVAVLDAHEEWMTGRAGLLRGVLGAGLRGAARPAAGRARGEVLRGSGSAEELGGEDPPSVR